MTLKWTVGFHPDFKGNIYVRERFAVQIVHLTHMEI